MEIYLIRHTTPAVDKGVCYGQTDLDLETTFDDEKLVVQQKMANKELGTIYSSPLKRCALLSTFLFDEVVLESEFKELDFGDWEMQKWEEIDPVDFNPWMENFVNHPAKNGESYLDLSNRVLHKFHQLKNKDVVVAHAGVIRAILASVTKTELKDSFQTFKVNYGEVIKVNTKENSYEIL